MIGIRSLRQVIKYLKKWLEFYIIDINVKCYIFFRIHLFLIHIYLCT